MAGGMVTLTKGAGIARWLEHWACDRTVPGFWVPAVVGGEILLQGRFPVLLFWYLAHKRSQSFCQNCRWQVTAKHTCTLPMWLWVTWPFFTIKQCCYYVSTTLWWILNNTLNRYSHSFRITCDMSAVSAQEQRIVLYKSNYRRRLEWTCS